MSLTKVTYAMIDGPVNNVLDYGAVGDGITDDTAAIQAAIDAAWTSGSQVVIPGGTYAVTGIKVYGLNIQDGYATTTGNASNILFEPGAVLKMTASSGFVIRSAVSPSQTIPTSTTFGLLYTTLTNPIIDMDSKGNCALWMEVAHHWKVTNIEIRNLPAGTFTYNDGHSSGTQTYDKCGIGIKGITGVGGAYNNVIVGGWVRGLVGAYGNTGLWLGTTKGQGNQQANFNDINDIAFTYCTQGVHVEKGSSQRLSMLNIFNCTTAFKIETDRNFIIKPYMEGCTTGMYWTSDSSYNVLQDLSSVASTTTPIDDQGSNNNMFPENYLPKYAAIQATGSTQSVVPNTWTKILLSERAFDVGNIAFPSEEQIRIDASGNGIGFYTICGTVKCAVVDGSLYELAIYKTSNQLTGGNATQTTATVAGDYQLSFNGSGSVTLSGTATGTFSAGTNSVTCTAGTLTITVTGTITNLFFGLPTALDPQASYIPGGSATVSLQVNACSYLNTLDRVELWMRHNNGSNCSVTKSSATQLFVTKAVSMINLPFGASRQ
jgi:hypothetical protein